MPAELRKKFHLKPGDTVSFTEASAKQGITIKPTMSWDELQKKNQAILKRNGIKPLSDEELDKAIDEAWADAAVERYKRSL